MKYTLITGASGGIGEAVVNRLAEKKHNLVLVARNQEKLRSLSEKLSKQYGIKVEYIASDLSKSDAAQNIFDETLKRGLEIEMLINNAGVGSGGEFAELDLKSELELIQLNNSSLVSMTHLFIQQMKIRKNGTIINVSSMSAFIPTPYMATYAASKVFVRFFTEALVEECKPLNIHIMLFCPGLTRTNFNLAAGLDAEKSKGLGTEYTSRTQTPEQVANEVIDAFDRKQHFRISGTANRISAKLAALIPDRSIAGFIAGNYRKQTGK